MKRFAHTSGFRSVVCLNSSVVPFRTALYAQVHAQAERLHSITTFHPNSPTGLEVAAARLASRVRPLLSIGTLGACLISPSSAQPWHRGENFGTTDPRRYTVNVMIVLCGCCSSCCVVACVLRRAKKSTRKKLRKKFFHDAPQQHSRVRVHTMPLQRVSDVKFRKMKKRPKIFSATGKFH